MFSFMAISLLLPLKGGCRGLTRFAESYFYRFFSVELLGRCRLLYENCHFQRQGLSPIMIQTYSIFTPISMQSIFLISTHSLLYSITSCLVFFFIVLTLHLATRLHNEYMYLFELKGISFLIIRSHTSLLHFS